VRVSRVKIFNDPVYGFISVPRGLILDLIDHPYFQRLRRIGQTSLTHYVYPGALHTRFHHALGAFHLTTAAIEVLRSKGVEITESEAQAVQIAVLLHDIGHGPFSHTLEQQIVSVHHEEMSLAFMQVLNKQFGGQLDEAIAVFENKHPKHFLSQLVSGQLDLDRMDYLNRDSFYTGVSEGVIGYDRIIKMLDERDGELVVEEKGIYSLEKFLIARRLMYWQVYLHKTVIVAEQMLIRVFRRARWITEHQNGLDSLQLSTGLRYFFEQSDTNIHSDNIPTLTKHFALLDDIDVLSSLKNWATHADPILSYLSRSILERKLLKIELQSAPIDPARAEQICTQTAQQWQLTTKEISNYFVFTGSEKQQAYNVKKGEIKILLKNETVVPMSESTDDALHSKIITKHYLCYPKSFRNFAM
jgi:uncharacterized protein